MGNDILFSIIVPVYNCGNYVGRCIKSILAQEEQYECFIIDDGSTDNSMEVIQHYIKEDARIKILSQRNAGQSAVRNRAIREATGKYLVFIDADDFVSDRALAVIKKTIINRNLQVAVFNTYAYDETLSKAMLRKPIIEKEYVDGKSFFKMFSSSGRYIFSAWVAVVERNYIEENGLYFNEGLSHGEDEVWLTKVLILAERVGVSNDAYYYNRIDRKGSLSMESNFRRICSIMNAIDELQDFAKNRDEEIRTLISQRCTMLIISALAMYNRVEYDKDIEVRLKQHLKLLRNGTMKYRVLGGISAMLGVRITSGICARYVLLMKKIRMR